MTGKSFILVNPCRATAQTYNTVLQSMGYKVYGLWTDAEHKETWKDSACTNLVHESFDEKLLFKIAPEIIGVIPCDDKAFETADSLQARLHPERCNDQMLALIRAKKNRYLTYLSVKGITEADVYTSQDFVGLPAGKWVAKPVDGAGNEDVYVFDHDKVPALPDRKMLVQEYIDGPEFCVEIVSGLGVHKCTSVMQYGGNHLVDGLKPWREENYLIEPRQDLIDYAIKIVDALGMRLGVTWTQIRLDSKGKPHLIEVNFRPQGNAHFEAIRDTTDTNYIRQSVRLYLGNFEGWSKEPDVYTKLGDFSKVSVNVKHTGQKPVVDWTDIKDLPSVKAVWVNHLLRAEVTPSTGFTTSLATLIVANQDVSQFAKDMVVINAFKEKLYGSH